MDGKTYVPIDTQVYMRHLISIEELERLLTRHPKVQKEIIENQNLRQLTDYYKETISQYMIWGKLTKFSPFFDSLTLTICTKLYTIIMCV